jgi:hypothetical protein
LKTSHLWLTPLGTTTLAAEVGATLGYSCSVQGVATAEITDTSTEDIEADHATLKAAGVDA